MSDSIENLSSVVALLSLEETNRAIASDALGYLKCLCGLEWKIPLVKDGIIDRTEKDVVFVRIEAVSKETVPPEANEEALMVETLLP